ncbi:MAG TPA: PilZ domain-containing protein [Chloroflexota bacterium]|jgi:hypothetical protein|nr:PilZ domain-containing protein [Chloroflexota bacterium]
MGADDSAYSLVPQMVLVAAPPEEVCVALQRYASNAADGKCSSDRAAHQVACTWTAQRQDKALGVTLTLQGGPLRSYVLRFSAQSDEQGATMLWITGAYAPRRSRLRGPLDRWQAHRDAVALRDGVVSALTSLVEQQARRSGPVLRRFHRKRVRAHARLCVASQAWTGEVLDVSEGGLALVVVCLPAQAEAAAAFMLQQPMGDVEIVLPGLNDRIPVLVRRAQPGRGGVEVGLQVLQPEKILPLVRKALARHQGAGT